MRKDKNLPYYYVSPTIDFRKYTKDSEEKHWDRETAFDWDQNVTCNLKRYLEGLDKQEFSRIVMLSLPILIETVELKIDQIKNHHLPLDEDALKDINESIPGAETIMDQAISIHEPLNRINLSVAKLSDQVEILRGELVDLQQQRKLGFFRKGLNVKPLQSDQEKKQQETALQELNEKYTQARNKLSELKSQATAESELIKPKVKRELQGIQANVLDELESTRQLLHRIKQSNGTYQSPEDYASIKSLLLKRQLRAMKDISNHALVVEQSAIAPLTMGIIHYRRHREIQEAMATFINDEAKHSATFRRFLVEKLNAREYVSDILIKGANRYMWIARITPGTGMFLAVIVEAIGAAYLEFFGNEQYMPEKLFRQISQTISGHDEVRHMNLCVGIYNELYRKGRWWEHPRNSLALRMIMKAVYGDKTDDHHLIQAFRVFGVDADTLYRHVMTRLSEQLSRISMYITPDELLKIIGRKS